MRDVLQIESPARAIGVNLKWAALISFVLVLPFAILESLNNPITRQNAPGLILLFGVLWLLPTAFIVILVPVVRAFRAGRRHSGTSDEFLAQSSALILIAWFWETSYRSASLLWASRLRLVLLTSPNFKPALCVRLDMRACHLPETYLALVSFCCCQIFFLPFPLSFPLADQKAIFMAYHRHISVLG